MSSKHPRNVGEKACPHYMKTGKCAYGRRCRFDHPPRKQKATPNTQNAPDIISTGISNNALAQNAAPISPRTKCLQKPQVYTSQDAVCVCVCVCLCVCVAHTRNDII